MKNLARISKLTLIALFATMFIAACSPRYSNGRYRPRKNNKCKCPAYSYNNDKTVHFYAFINNANAKNKAL